MFAITAVVLPAATIAGSLMWIGRTALTESLYREQSETARRISDRISIHMEHVRSVLSIGASEPGLAVFPRRRQEESLRRLLRWQDSFKEAFLIDEHGQETAKLTSQRNRFVPAAMLISRKNRAEYLSPMQDGKIFVSEPFFAADRLPYLLAACPVSGRKAVLVARVSLANLWDLVNEVQQGQPGIAYIVDTKGNLIAHPDSLKVQSHTNLENTEIVRSFLEGRVGHDSFGVHRNERGEKVVALTLSVPDLRWAVVMETPTRDAYAAIRLMQRQVIRWTLICTVAVLIFAFWRVRQITRPVKLLEDGVRKISQGELNLRLDIDTRDEIERLSHAFEKMADSLRELETMRRDLISMIVHDLKNPLSGIMNGIEYLIENAPESSPEPHRRVLTLARKSSEDLLSLVQNLLDVAKMEEGRLTLNRESASLSKILRECVETFSVQAVREQKHLVVKAPDDMPEISMDVQLIGRVLNNLVFNAIRHTSTGGQVTLEGRTVNNEAEITVRDNGEGIPEEYRDKIFDKFVQAERKRMHMRSGAGLGLTFCKMAIELHGGKISVESKVGEGSAFSFRLPLDRAESKQVVTPAGAA